MMNICWENKMNDRKKVGKKTKKKRKLEEMKRKEQPKEKRRKWAREDFKTKDTPKTAQQNKQKRIEELQELRVHYQKVLKVGQKQFI